MSTRGTCGRGTGGCGRGRRGTQAGSSSSGHIPNLETSEMPASPVTKSGSGSYDRAAGDDALSQAMLWILERVVGPNTEAGGRGSIMERLRSNGAEIFRGIAGVAPNVAEYWIEAVERIMDDLDCTPEQKLKGVISLLRDEAYQWWLTGKYLKASYVDAHRKEFLNLTQGDRSVAEFEAEFLRLSHYARGMVATEYERCVHFEDGLKDNLRRERDFAALVDKVKTTEKRGRNKRDSEPSSSIQRPKKKARVDGLTKVGAPIIATGQPPCTNCGRHHQGECWKRSGACLRCGSLEHRIRGSPLRSDQMQASGMGTAPPRVVQQPPRGRGQARGGNGLGRGQRALGRGAIHTEARQPALVYVALRREDVPYTAWIDIGSTHSYTACSVTENLGILVESTTSKVTILSPLGQSVRVNKLFRNIPLEVQGAIFSG
ncbi:ATP-dependent zinc metalloprotease FtsH [Gossypium australe]|uniref:ATP-dependent zinc metalloprotease FtsH n=1 Tax=Gossypium australe TaxID=47621 RepID=A0A5B6VY02_9ROSI|nr:ATP-dependent zinc metalloprotease FtsH [Gossypium australe]